MSPDEVLVAYVTAPDAGVGETLASLLVEEGLAACVNRVPNVRSTYRWKGEICHDAEELLIIKTTRGAWSALVRRVGEAHPHEVPECIAVPVAEGSRAYLEWVRSGVKR
jgi:periplasmic divalent cation tolerance protein